ncbi:hypothetical protein Tsubulata_030957 [Turnera subulata]|uniref:Uncharacterized protein n=1 Tax=Turnera subulata TaxID=218843 RepID=A0A9Q0GAF2_9ROSI|nr:hypothetical protein Tsubulata_030957 [Turnera subulata]
MASRRSSKGKDPLQEHPTKRRSSSSSGNQYPVEGTHIWFTSRSQLNRFNTLFAKRLIAPPRYLPAEYPQEKHYTNLPRLLQQSHLWEFVTRSRHEYNADFIWAFYSTLTREGEVLSAQLNGKVIQLTLEQFGAIAKLPVQGHDISGYGADHFLTQYEIPLLAELGITEVKRNRLNDLFTTKAGVLPPSQRTIRYSYSSRKAPKYPPPLQIEPKGKPNSTISGQQRLKQTQNNIEGHRKSSSNTTYIPCPDPYRDSVICSRRKQVFFLLHKEPSDTGLSDLFTTKAGVLPPSQRTIRYSYSSRKAPKYPPPLQIEPKGKPNSTIPGQQRLKQTQNNIEGHRKSSSNTTDIPCPDPYRDSVICSRRKQVFFLLHKEPSDTGLSDLFTTKAGVLPPSQRTIRYK